MNLPASIARCPGRYQQDPAAWPFPREADDCTGCARRQQAIADYMAGAKVEWMNPPLQTPCPEKLEAKR